MKLRTDLTLRQVAGEFIIVDPGKEMVDMSKVFTLNETSAKVWEELQGKDFSIATVTQVLTTYYEVSEDVARADASILVDQFNKHGLLI